jgi:hypothetical protein
MPAIRSSQSQVEANQLNAQKSTGPRTPDGKARSSQSALKHGLTAKTLLRVQTVQEGLGGIKPRAALTHAKPRKRALALCCCRSRTLSLMSSRS